MREHGLVSMGRSECYFVCLSALEGASLYSAVLFLKLSVNLSRDLQLPFFVVESKILLQQKHSRSSKQFSLEKMTNLFNFKGEENV